MEKEQSVSQLARFIHFRIERAIKQRGADVDPSTSIQRDWQLAHFLPKKEELVRFCKRDLFPRRGAATCEGDNPHLFIEKN